MCVYACLWGVWGGGGGGGGGGGYVFLCVYMYCVHTQHFVVIMLTMFNAKSDLLFYMQIS